MSNFILKNSGGINKIPSLLDLKSGEISINTVTGQLYTRITHQDGDSITTIDSATMLVETFQPEFDMTSVAEEGSTIDIFLSNYNKAQFYKVYVSGGYVNTLSNPFKWTLPVVENTELHSIRISATEYEKTESKLSETKWISVINVPSDYDNAILLNSNNIDLTTVPYTNADPGTITEIKILETDDVVETVEFKQEDIDEDWVSEEVEISIIHKNLMIDYVKETSTFDSIVIKTENENEIKIGDSFYIKQKNDIVKTQIGLIEQINVNEPIKSVKYCKNMIIYHTNSDKLIVTGDFNDVLENVQEFAVGAYHAVALTKTGEIYTIGGYDSHSCYALGLGKSTSVSIWTKTSKKGKRVMAGYKNTFIVDENNINYACGSFNYYTFYTSTQNVYKSTFVAFDISDPIKMILDLHTACGYITENETFYFNGYDSSNPIHYMNYNSDSANNNGFKISNLPIPSKALIGYKTHILYLHADGNLWVFGDAAQNPDLTITSYGYTHVIDNVKDICATTFNSYYLTFNGELYANGLNNNGMLGDYANDSRTFIKLQTPTIPVSLGNQAGFESDQVFYVDAKGDVYMMGLAKVGGLDHDSVKFEKVDYSRQTGVKLSNFNPPLKKPEEELKLEFANLSYELGMYASYKITKSKVLYVRGLNSHFRFGIGVVNEVFIDWVPAGIENVIQIIDLNYGAAALKEDGTIWIAGENNNLYFGNGSIDETEIQSWTKVDSINDVKFIYGYDRSLWAVKYDGSVSYAGMNRGGTGIFSSSNISSFTRVFYEPGEMPVKITYNRERSAILMDSGNIYASGNCFDTNTTEYNKSPLQGKDIHILYEASARITLENTFYIKGKYCYGLDYNISSIINYTPPKGKILKNLTGNDNYLYFLEDNDIKMIGRSDGLIHIYDAWNIVDCGIQADMIYSNNNNILLVDYNGLYKVQGKGNYNCLTNTINDYFRTPIEPDNGKAGADLLLVDISTISVNLSYDYVPEFLYKTSFKSELSISNTENEDQYIKINLKNETPEEIYNGLRYRYEKIEKTGRYIKFKIEGLLKNESIPYLNISLKKDV